MYLAINYSPAAARLIRSGQINIDCLKTPNWDWMIAEASNLRPVAIHFNLEAGNDNLAEVDWDRVSQQMHATNTPFINLHLDARQTYYPAYKVDTREASEVEVVREVIFSDVGKAMTHFDANQVIIENSPYQGIEENTMELCIQPGLINHLVQETGCGLLLDISHAIITAKYLGIKPDEYLSSLPIHRIKELHFAGMHFNQSTGMWMDHLSIQEEDWHWLDWVLARILSGEWSAPWLLAFEYGGVGEPFEWRTNPEVIAEQVPLLYEHMKALSD